MSELRSVSPWDGCEVGCVSANTTENIAEQVYAMHRSGVAWSVASDRPERLRRFAEILVRRREEIIDLLIREAGKVRADASAEADLLAKKIFITLNEGLARTPAFAAEGIIAWRARGVAACIGPYNFPLHLLHGLVIPALAVGCTVLAKPSERCPALGELYSSLLLDAGLSDVCRVIHGGHEATAALVMNPRVMTVGAVGSRGMGEALARLISSRPEAVLALELGGVNHALILDDADRVAAATAVADGAWRMAGQRCTATRIVHVPNQDLPDWIARLQIARGAWVPAGQQDGVVGAMIDAQQRELFQKPYRSLPDSLTLEAGDPNAASDNSAFADPLLLSVHHVDARNQDLYAHEHFGPALIIDSYNDLDECLTRVAANPFRLAAAIFTASRDRFRACALRLPYGQVNHNRPTAGARSDLPFGGCGLSGNGRPAALSAGRIFADETVVWGEDV